MQTVRENVSVRVPHRVREERQREVGAGEDRHVESYYEDRVEFTEEIQVELRQVEVSQLDTEVYQDEGAENCLDFACTVLDELKKQGVDISQYQVVLFRSTVPGEPGHVGLLGPDNQFFDAAGATDYDAWQAAHPELELLTDEPRGDLFLEAMSLPPGEARDDALAALHLAGLTDEDLAIAPLIALGALAVAALILSGCGPVEDEMTLEEAREILQNMPPRDSLADMTTEELRALNVVHDAFVDEQMLVHHHEWHDANGSGGTIGPGSGYDFLLMHRDMMRAFEAFVGGDFSMPEWDPTQPPPAELLDPSADPERVALLQRLFPEFAGGVPPRDGRVDPFAIPPYLTAAGGGSVTVTADWGPAYADLAGRTFNSLNDFRDPDELGRVLGLTYHGAGHNEVGGVMASLASPADPIFYGWHEHIDRIIDEWLATPAGQAWAAANPDDPLLDARGGEHNHG